MIRDCRNMNELHPIVRKRLQEIGAHTRRKGGRLFVFGSIAETWPQARKGADLDVGFEGLDAEAAEEIKRLLTSLPSIRPVDIVDFDQADAAFKTVAKSKIVLLSHD